MMQRELMERINNKSAIISIVGLGYVGLPLMLRFAEVGFKVLGIDVDRKKIDNINNGQSYIQHICSNKLSQLQHNLMATDDFSQATEADVIILCVPTPLDKYREPDLSYVLKKTHFFRSVPYAIRNLESLLEKDVEILNYIPTLKYIFQELKRDGDLKEFKNE